MTEKEREEAEKATQSYASLGIGFVCILVGVPLWWKTTEIYRVQLPHGKISELATAQIPYRIHFTMVMFDETLSASALAEFGQNLRQTFETIDSDGGWLNVKYKGNVRNAKEEEKKALQQAITIEDLDKKLSVLLPKQDNLYYLAVLPRSSTLGIDQGYIGPYRTVYLRSKLDLDSLLSPLKQLLREVIVDETGLSRTFQTARGVRNLQDDKESMRSLHYQPGYQLTFTLLNPQPDIIHAHWNIKDAIDKYLQPTLDAFGDFVQITAKSQYLHFYGIGVRPKRDPSGKFSVLRTEDLPHIINPIEAYLSSHVSTYPNLNFLVYIPTRDQTPLHIVNEIGVRADSNAFLSPRWGGLLVHNVEITENATLPYAAEFNMKSAMEVFISQLRLLLGLHPKSSYKNIVTGQPGSKGVADWELDAWMRARTLENIASSTATLQSLIQLLDEVSNIVINDAIGSEVERAVASIQKSHTLLHSGKLREAFLQARQAMIASEKAFFDPSLLELLYFPEDQKFAIYIPLFLPISIPIILSMIQAFKWLRSNKQKQE